MSEKVALIGYLLIAAQILCADWDQYLTRGQLHEKRIVAYSLMEHGGFWCDIFFITPITARVVYKYQLAYISWWSPLLFIGILALIIKAGIVYQELGRKIPVPYAHDGKTPPAGWIHGIFAIAAFWIMGMFYLTPITPSISTGDLMWISLGFTLFFFIGIVDFNRRWVFMDGAKIQIAIETIVLWIVAAIHLKLRQEHGYESPILIALGICTLAGGMLGFASPSWMRHFIPSTSVFWPTMKESEKTPLRFLSAFVTALLVGTFTLSLVNAV